MQEVMLKTHLIVTDVHDEYSIKWCGKIVDTHPKIKNGLPIFSIVGSGGRIELNTTDMKRIERAAKALTQPHSRKAVATDKAYIYIQEEDDKETLMGILTHNHIKTYQQMYDKFGYYE